MVKFVYMAVDENEDVYYETASFFENDSLVYARNEGIDFAEIRRFALSYFTDYAALRELCDELAEMVENCEGDCEYWNDQYDEVVAKYEQFIKEQDNEK